MLLAAGVYPAFVDAIADTTRLRFRFRSLIVLACVGLAAGLSILLLAGQLKLLVVNHRWMMYSLFIGLTMGGVPVVWRLARPASAGLLAAAGLSFLGMVVLAVLQAKGVIASPRESFFMLLLAGLAGASAMILPGLSGGYLLLLMGQYVPILAAIDAFKEALKARDFAAAMPPALSVMLPVGIGVVAGVVIVGNLLQWLLKRHRQVTLGALLGLLVGSTVGLFPFQRPIPPIPGQRIKGEFVTADNIDAFDQEDWNTEFYRPPVDYYARSLGLICLGFGITLVIAKIGGDDSSADDEQPARSPTVD